MKQIIVDSCGNCPNNHCERGIILVCDHPDVPAMVIYNSNIIPDWCPLEDVTDGGKKG